MYLGRCGQNSIEVMNTTTVDDILNSVLGAVNRIVSVTAVGAGTTTTTVTPKRISMTNPPPIKSAKYVVVVTSARAYQVAYQSYELLVGQIEALANDIKNMPMPSNGALTRVEVNIGVRSTYFFLELFLQAVDGSWSQAQVSYTINKQSTGFDYYLTLRLCYYSDTSPTPPIGGGDISIQSVGGVAI